MTGNVFISYRRSGDGMAAGRLHRELSDALGREHVFMDVDDIPMGVDFHDYLDGQVARCDVFLAIIGPGWLGAVPRLANADDFVRIEIESALSREDIRIIPLLIDDAEMPEAADLPQSLRPLLRRNGGRLTHAGFSDGVRRLARQIETPVGTGWRSATAAIAPWADAPPGLALVRRGGGGGSGGGFCAVRAIWT